MTRILIIFLLFSSTYWAGAQDAPERAAGYEHLQHFVGRWTEQGNEKTFVEVCDWFDGKYHVICNAERKRSNGTIGRSLSILSYVPGQGYVHVGISKKGRYETLQNGTFRDGIFEFLSTAKEEGKSIVTRIRIGPFAERGFPFVVHTSTDGGPWVEAGITNYVKLD